MSDLDRSTPGRGHRIVTGAGPSTAPSPEQLRHLYRLSDPTLAELDLNELLDELLGRVKDALRVDTVAILLLEPAAGRLVARAARGIEEEVEQGVTIPLGQGFAGRIASERVPIFIQDVDHAEVLNPILREKGIRSLLGVPLVAQGELIGVLHVGSLTQREFSVEDVALLELAAARAAPAIERAALFDALEREHQAAVALQRSLLPERLPEVAGATLAARYLPAADEVGGDWYDVIALSRGRLGLVIGDVAGHGVRAASLMGQLRTAVRAYALENHDPPGVLAGTDRVLRSMRERGMTTLMFAVFDPEDGTVELACSAHPPPLIIRSGGGVDRVALDPGPPLGARLPANYRQTSVRLCPGDTLLFYTDGLIERRGERLSAGIERLAQAADGNGSPEQVCTRVLSRVIPDGGNTDDIAMLAVQNAPVPEVLHLRYPAEPSVLAPMRAALRRWMRQRGIPEPEMQVVTLACGEACANAIEHAYSPETASFELRAHLEGETLVISIRDAGNWRAPRGQNRGRGLFIMERAMDEFAVNATPHGTEVLMRRRIAS